MFNGHISSNDLRLSNDSLDSGFFEQAQARRRLTQGDDEYRAGNLGEYVVGLQGDDLIVGGNGSDHLKGNAGDDTLGGGRGQDILEGGIGNDRLLGYAGRDQLSGGDGDDFLQGGSGADILAGGLGSDTIYVNDNGSDGARDIVVYASLAEVDGDQIFSFVAGQDKVDLSAIDADPSTPEDDAFTFIGERAFSGVAGEVRIGGGIEIDVDGDGLVDGYIGLTWGSGVIHARDFVL